jgi:hypothetical protein
MGNQFAIRPGKNNTLPPVGLGSHLDTQPAGGRYDGIAGVLTALEVLRTIADNNVETYAPLAVINWVSLAIHPLPLFGLPVQKSVLIVPAGGPDKRRRCTVPTGHAFERRVGRCVYQGVWVNFRGRGL